MGFFSNLLRPWRERRQAEANLATFKAQLLAAVFDGRLSPAEIDRLNDLKLQLHLSEEDVATFAGPAYASAFQAVTRDGALTEAEEKELREIQFYLLVPNDQITANREELQRLRLLREIQQNKLPTIT